MRAQPKPRPTDQSHLVQNRDPKLHCVRFGTKSSGWAVLAGTIVLGISLTTFGHLTHAQPGPPPPQDDRPPQPFFENLSERPRERQNREQNPNGNGQRRPPRHDQDNPNRPPGLFPERPRDNPPRMDGTSSDQGTTLPYPMRMALTEVRHLPTLEPHIRRMAELYQERARLEHIRRKSAHGIMPPATGGQPSERLREFHGLLANEDRIAAEMEKTLDQIRKQSPAILEEISRRREFISKRKDQIEADLEQAEGSTVDDPDSQEKGTSSRRSAAQQELRNLRRAERLHLVLQDRVNRLRELQPGQEPSRRIARGGLQEFLGLGSWGNRDLGPPDRRQAAPNPPDGPEDGPPRDGLWNSGNARRPADPMIHRRIVQIESEAEALRRRLEDLERERENLLTLPAQSPRPESADSQTRQRSE